MHARFKVQANTVARNGVADLRLTSAGIEGNEEWAKDVAHAELRFTVSNPDATDLFKIGDVVIVNVTKDDKKQS
jgi:hypothetical protein